VTDTRHVYVPIADRDDYQDLGWRRMPPLKKDAAGNYSQLMQWRLPGKPVMPKGEV
jgi:hypothetical protein